MADYNEPKMQDVPDDSEEFELGHTDKLVGVFTTPTEIFGKISNFPPKVIDWFLPIFLVIIVGVFGYFVKMSNPVINYTVVQQQRETTSKALEDRIKSGQITQEQADQQLDNMESMINSPIAKVIGVLGGLIGGFIVFFIMGGVYHLFAKFALKGDGTYSFTLVAYGLASYILVLQHILSTIFSLLTSKMAMDFSIATIAGMDKATPLGYALSFLDPVALWFYFVFGIALAKVFKSDNTKKYIITIFAVWIGISVFFYLLAQVIPFFKFFVGK